MKSAFTLLEVVLILGIMAVLATMLMPLVNRARLNAQRTSCQSNLKQISLGVSQYTRDYDETYPLAYTDFDGVEGYNPATDKGWAESLGPYLKNARLFSCPTEPESNIESPLTTDYWMAAPMTGTRFAQVAKPTWTVLSGDGIQSSAAMLVTHGAIAYRGDAPSLKYNGEIWDVTGATEGKGGRRHLEGLNIGFADGHIKWFKPERITAEAVSKGGPTFRIK